jgi:hypothetical protein
MFAVTQREANMLCSLPYERVDLAARQLDSPEPP